MVFVVFFMVLFGVVLFFSGDSGFVLFFCFVVVVFVVVVMMFVVWWLVLWGLWVWILIVFVVMWGVGGVVFFVVWGGVWGFDVVVYVDD